jgi:RNA methyltransferase, TrmH family
METIESIKHPLVVAARALNKAKNRDEAYLIEGEKAIRWALDAGVSLQHVFVVQQTKHTSLMDRLTTLQIQCLQCGPGIMKKINESKFLCSAIAVAKIPKSVLVAPSRFVLMMESIQDQGNLGTMIRTASALGIQQVITTGEGSDVYNKKTMNASRGTCFSINHFHVSSSLDAIKSLKQKGFQIVATTPRGEQLQSALKLDKKPVALIVGNETNGISDTVFAEADYRVQIPMSPTVESLNVGVAAGISMYELNIKGILVMLKDHIRQTLGREIGVAHQLLQQQLDQLLKAQCDISATQARLLMIMTCDQNMTLDQIERDLACHGDALAELLKPLLERQFISKTEDNFNITPEGEAFLARIWSIIEQAEINALADFSADEIALFKSFIQRMKKNCI